MSGGGTQQSIRKALGAIKDSTTVGLAKVNSEFVDLDVAIVKATTHVERPAHEKHIRAIFSYISASRPRADVAYCIHALSRRLSKTRNWAVALKTLIVIHRALREVDPSFREELINYRRNRGHILNLSHFKDDSSPNAWDYSAWVRVYALFLEERLECFRVIKYDIETDPPRIKALDTIDLLDHLPSMQQFLSRLLACQPQGAAVYNFIIQSALSMVAQESIKIYDAISDGTVNLVDKFFEMKRHHAVRALDIYRRVTQQSESLSKFYEVCKGLDVGRGEKFINIEQPPASFLTAMEEYVKEAPRSSIRTRDMANNVRETPKVVLALEYKKSPEAEKSKEEQETHVASPQPVEEPVKTEPPKSEPVDLLGLNNYPDTSTLEEKNALALAIVPAEKPRPDLVTTTTGWELTLVKAPSSNDNAVADSKLAGGLDRLILDSLYDDAMTRKASQIGAYQPWQEVPVPFGMPQIPRDPFCASNVVAPPMAVQMALVQQQHMMMQGQQQQLVNPFGNPYGGIEFLYPYGSGMPVAVHNSHRALI